MKLSYMFLSHLSGDEAVNLRFITTKSFLSHLSGDEGYRTRRTLRL